MRSFLRFGTKYPWCCYQRKINGVLQLTGWGLCWGVVVYNAPVVRNRKTWIWLGAWLILLVVAFMADQPVKRWLFAHQFHGPTAGLMKGMPWATAVKALGNFLAVLVIAATLVVARQLSWRRGVVLLLTAATAIFSDVVKWVAGRQRPIGKDGVLTGLFDFVPFSMREAGNAFPSGHTMLAFATATCLSVYYPRWRYLCFGAAVLVALERFLEVAHHVSDVVAAAGLGVILSLWVMRLLRRWSEV